MHSVSRCLVSWIGIPAKSGAPDARPGSERRHYLAKGLILGQCESAIFLGAIKPSAVMSSKTYLSVRRGKLLWLKTLDRAVFAISNPGDPGVIVYVDFN